jgi:hypothetical protein
MQIGELCEYWYDHALTCEKGSYANTGLNTVRNTILVFTRQARIYPIRNLPITGEKIKK